MYLPRLAVPCMVFAIICSSASPPAAADTQALPAAAPSPTPCRIVNASLMTPLNSKDTRPGTVFQFNVPEMDQGASGVGYGIVKYVRGAKRGGVPGEIGVEARFVALTDGSHVPATLVADAKSAVYSGKERNVPFPISAAAGATPVTAPLFGAYGFLHSGSQAVIPSGTKLRLVLGDDYLTGACRLS